MNVKCFVLGMLNPKVAHSGLEFREAARAGPKYAFYVNH